MKFGDIDGDQKKTSNCECCPGGRSTFKCCPIGDTSDPDLYFADSSYSKPSYLDPFCLCLTLWAVLYICDPKKKT